jgi:group I intron endonuclease
MPLSKEERCSAAIYAIRNKVDGKIYIGSSVRPAKRWNAHRSDLRKGRHHALRLQRAWDKYGEGCFSFEILENVADAIFLLAREQFWIWRTACTDPASGYNVCVEAGSARGLEWSDESRERQRINGLRIGISDACRAAQREVMRGDVARAAQAKTVFARKIAGTYSHTEETRRKLSECQRGRVPSESARLNMKAAQQARRAREAETACVAI